MQGGGGGGGGDRLAQSALEGKLLLALQEQQRLKEERRKATADKAELQLQFDALLDEKQKLERAQLTSEHERLKVAKAIVDLQVLLPPLPTLHSGALRSWPILHPRGATPPAAGGGHGRQERLRAAHRRAADGGGRRAEGAAGAAGQHGQSGRLGEAIAGHHGLLGLHPKACGGPPQS